MTSSKIPDEAFEFYVGLGPGRSYEAVAAHYDVSKNGVAKKAARDNWTDRLVRIERDVQDRMDKKIADSIEDMRERHLKAAKAMMGRAIKGMQEFPLTSGMEAIRAAELAIKLERLIAGESSERTEISVTEAIKRETQRWLVAKEGGLTMLGQETFTCQLDKAAFFEDIGYKPHEGQKPIHESRAPRRIVVCGVRWGKTTLAAMEGLAAAMEPATRSVGWVVAPTYDLADKVFREILFMAHRKLPHRIVKVQENQKRIVLRNTGGGESEIRAKSADNPVSLLGEGLDWLVVDEAARLKPRVWEGHLSQRLIDKKGWALLISTPKGKGVFYDLFRLGQGLDPSYESWNRPSASNPHLDADHVNEQRLRIPERVYAQEYLAEFLEGAGSVFRNVRDCAVGELQEPVRGESYFAGLDLAKVQDYTVLVIMNKRREVVFVDRFHRIDWSLQIERVKAAAERYGGARILCDSTGAGEPLYEDMRKAGLRVDSYKFTAQSKTDLINHLSLMLEQKKLVLPRPEAWPEGIDELESFEYSVTETGHTRTGAPSGYHDDCVIALALAAWQVKAGSRRAVYVFDLATGEIV